MTGPPEWLVGQATLNSHTYTYDDVYQLTNAGHPQAYNPDETFTYDPVGNRLTSHLSNTHAYDNMNRLLEDETYTYTYDANGNLTGKIDKISNATTTYQYDGEDKLIQVLTPTDFVEYRYDGFGRRIAKTVNGVVTKYVYDNEDILFELDGNNLIKARYTHGPGIDEPISVDRDIDSDGVFDVTYYYNYDGLGSVTEIIDSAGTIVQSYEYDTFGNIVSQTGSIENSYAYTGREWEAETGLYFYRARYYDATIGRFVTNDPIGFAGGDVNFYVYVQNNPVNFVDPFGLIGPKDIPGFGSTEVDLSVLVSHEVLSNTALSAGIVGSYAAATGYGLPPAIVFGSIAIVAKSLDIYLYSNNAPVDTIAECAGQLVPAPYNLLANPAINYIADEVKDKIDEN